MKRYGLLGYPLGHSFSATFFAEKFEKEGIDAIYNNYERPEIGDLHTWVEEEKLSGFNVTIPHKLSILSELDEIAVEAQEIGAVNVVKVEHRAGTPFLRGYNSDVIGFLDSLTPHLEPHHQQALVLGTGGASRAIVYGLKSLGIKTHLVSRTAEKGQYTYDDINPEIIATHHLIVNCTPLGTFPNIEGCPDLPYDLLTEKHFLYDLVYNPAETLFLKKGSVQGTKIVNGLQMLILQAEAAWDFWNLE